MLTPRELRVAVEKRLDEAGRAWLDRALTEAEAAKAAHTGPQPGASGPARWELDFASAGRHVRPTHARQAGNTQRPEGTPETREARDTREAPGTREVPGTREAPGAPEVLGAREVPGTREASGVREVLGALEVPGTRDASEARDAREAPGVPEVPGARGAPGVPEVPGAREAPGVPEVPGARGAPGVPEVPGARGAPGVPEVLGAPEGARDASRARDVREARVAPGAREVHGSRGPHRAREAREAGAAPDLPDAVRVLLLHAANVDARTAARLYAHGTGAERRAVLLALPYLRIDGADAVPLVEDALRTNDTRLVAAAVGPFAARHLSPHSWRQAVLKCLFTGVPLTAVADWERRARGDAELARMLTDYARERTAAGRPVPGDLDPVLARTRAPLGEEPLTRAPSREASLPRAVSREES